MTRLCVFPLLALALAGCVGVRSETALVPPKALCSHLRAPITVPRGPVDLVGLKVGESGAAWHFQEWVFSGLSGSYCEMLLKEAAENGDIGEVLFADYEQISYLGFVTRFKVTVYGR